MTAEEIKALSDQELIEVVKHSNNYSEEDVAMAAALVREKELLSDEEIEAFEDAQEIEREQQINIDENKLQQYLQKLKLEQNLPVAVIAGAVAAIISAIIWAVVTVSTGYQIGYIAIGVGFLVGLAVRLTGKGISPIFGIIGALFALIGCTFGNLLSIVGFVAQQEGLDYFNTFLSLDWSVVPAIMKDTFSPIDLVFYGFALYFGYKFSFKQISEEEIIEHAGT